MKEQQKIEAKGFVNFLEDPDNLYNRNIRRKKDGSCFFLTEENACKIHDVKPSICILEPFIITNYDCKTNRIFLDLSPFAAINCKGIFTGEMIAPEEIGRCMEKSQVTGIESLGYKEYMSFRTPELRVSLTLQNINLKWQGTRVTCGPEPRTAIVQSPR